MPADNKYTFDILGNDKTKKMFRRLAANTRKVVNTAATVGGAAAAGLAVMVQKTVKANTEMTRLALSVGVSSEELSRWSHAGKSVNLEAEKMADIFKDVGDKIGDFATTGGGGAVDMFEQLNLKVEDFTNLKPDEQLIKIGEALDGVQSRSEKIFFLEALAGDASRLLPLLENGAEGLKEMVAEADALGVTVTELDAAKMEAAQRSIERAQAAAVGFANTLSAELSPLVEVLVDEWVEFAGEGDRVGEAIAKGMTFAAKGAGIFADGLHGVKILIKGVETLARAMNFVLVGGFVKLIEILADVSNAIVDGLFWPIKKVLELAAPFSDMAADALKDVENLVDRIQVKVPESMREFADAQSKAFDVARGELHELLMEDLPGEVIKANIDRVLAEADAKAQERVKEIRANLAAGVADGGDVEDPRDVKERERIEKGLAALEEQYATEAMLLRNKLEEELLIINDAQEKTLLTEEQANEKRIRSAEEFEAAKTKLVTVAEKGRLAMLQGVQTLAQAFQDSGSKKMFKAGKALALASAAVSLPSAVIKSYENAGGYPWGIVPALAMAATGMANIAKIKNTQFYGGGGGATPVRVTGGGGAGGGGSSANLPAPIQNDIQTLSRQNDRDPVDGRGNVTVFNISGDVVGDSAEAMLERMREMVEGSDVVFFSNESRQAQELAGG